MHSCCRMPLPAEPQNGLYVLTHSSLKPRCGVRQKHVRCPGLSFTRGKSATSGRDRMAWEPLPLQESTVAEQ